MTLLIDASLFIYAQVKKIFHPEAWSIPTYNGLGTKIHLPYSVLILKTFFYGFIIEGFRTYPSNYLVISVCLMK